jgi:alkylation response protein AidB-like acyl-CoA dehydrogenase
MHFEADKTLMDAARAIGPLIRKHADEAERERRLSKPVLQALKETGLLKMATPKSLGGLESDPITRALVVEEIGRHDSAAGWTLENPVDWAFFCARLPDEGAEEIYAKGADVLIAGQLGRPLAARAVDGGYNVSGRAPFVSNCLDADWISCTAVVDAEKHPDREPETRMVYFPVDKCKVIDNWHVMGMRGTGSHDIEVVDLFVPEEHTFSALDLRARVTGPMNRMHGFDLAGCGFCCVGLGVARAALDTFVDRALVQARVGEAEAVLRSGRAYLFDVVEEMWQTVLDKELVTERQRSDLRMAMTHAAQSAARATRMVCEAAGTTSIFTRSPLERYARDAEVVTRHNQLQYVNYEAVGRTVLGLESNSPLF